jgi:hypothetical protein
MTASSRFVIFGLTLLGVALFHRRALAVAFVGLIVTMFLRIIGTLPLMGTIDQVCLLMNS